MVHVAREMERRGFEAPLLIGGATTSRKHTAVKIAPAFGGPTLHVADASRAPAVVSGLVGPERQALIEENRSRQSRARAAFEAGSGGGDLVSIEEARERRLHLDFGADEVAVPRFTGLRTLDPPVEEVAGYIDWGPFFHLWDPARPLSRHPGGRRRAGRAGAGLVSGRPQPPAAGGEGVLAADPGDLRPVPRRLRWRRRHRLR